MPFLFNPITGKLDLVQNLTDYAKLAISITHDAFQALYNTGTLIPMQWYLITDYTTYRFIVGDINTYYRGPVEPIYIQALDVNKVNPVGHSKAFPDEIVYYNPIQSVNSKSFNTSATLNEGVPSGGFDLAVLSPTTIDLSDAPYPPLQGLGWFFQIQDITSGAYFYFTDSNKDVDWKFNEDGNFELLNTEYTTDIWNDASWNTNDGSTGGVPIIVEGNDEIALDGDRFDNYIFDADRGAGGYLYDDDLGANLYFDLVNKGHIWDIDPTSGNIIFTNLGADINGYVNFVNGDGNYGDYAVEVSSSTTFWIDWSAVNSPGTFYNGSTGIDVYWSDETSDYLEWSNFGVTWEVNGNEVVLIGNSHDLTSDLVSISGTMFGNSTSDILQIENTSYGEVNVSLVKSVVVELDLENPVNIYFQYSYTVPVNGYIYARYNVPKNFHCDLDYRGRLIRRYALQNLGAWVSGTTYTYNQVVTSGGLYYLCFATSTTAGVTNNSVWFPIGEVGNYYGATNLQSYSGLQVLYNSSVYSDIQMFNVSAFDSATKRMNSSIRNSVGSSTDLNALILNFNDNSFYESDIFVDGWLLSRNFFRSTTGLFINSIVGGVTSSTATYVTGSILPMLSLCNINQISGVFAPLSTSQLGVVTAVIAQRITSSKLTDFTLGLFAQGCVGNTINVGYSIYCEQSFNGNNILNSNSTPFGSVKLLNIPGYLCSFNGNIITSTFSNVAIQARGFISDNKFYNTFQNVDWNINSVQGCVFNGSIPSSQVDNTSAGFFGSTFSSNSNVFFASNPLTISSSTFSGTASIQSSLYAFEFSGVNVLPDTTLASYTYTYQNINLTSGTGTETAAKVRAVYSTDAGSPYSGVMFLATRRKPVASGSLTRYDGGGDITINYSNSYKMNNLMASTSATVLPDVGDVYANGSELFWYTGKSENNYYWVCKNIYSSTLTLTRVTGSGPATISMSFNGEPTCPITTSFFASTFTSLYGTFGRARITSGTFLKSINNAILDSAGFNQLTQEYDLNGVFQGTWKSGIRTKYVTTTYSATLNDETIFVDGTFNLTLITAIDWAGKNFIIKNVGTGIVSLVTASSQTIDGILTKKVFPGETVEVQSDGANYFVLRQDNSESHYIAKTANYTLTSDDGIVNCTANTFTITLPTAVGITGRTYIIKNSGTGVITVDAEGTQTIDGELTQTLIQWECLQLMSNGTNWIVL